MKTLRSISALALLLGICSCSSLSVQTSADPQTDLTRYKTFAWAPERSENGEAAPTSITAQTVRSSVEQELASKGLQPADPSNADLLISSFGGTRNEVNYAASPYYGYPSYPYYGTTYITRQGSLTLQFIDSKDKKIVWQGTATDAISDAGANQEQVKTAVRELLEEYPRA